MIQAPDAYCAPNNGSITGGTDHVAVFVSRSESGPACDLDWSVVGLHVQVGLGFGSGMCHSSWPVVCGLN